MYSFDGEKWAGPVTIGQLARSMPSLAASDDQLYAVFAGRDTPAENWYHVNTYICSTKDGNSWTPPKSLGPAASVGDSVFSTVPPAIGVGLEGILWVASAVEWSASGLNILLRPLTTGPSGDLTYVDGISIKFPSNSAPSLFTVSGHVHIAFQVMEGQNSSIFVDRQDGPLVWTMPFGSIRLKIPTNNPAKGFRPADGLAAASLPADPIPASVQAVA